MVVEIEDYRGIDIFFNTVTEKFQCVITEGFVKESLSYKAVKKYIDDYKKENSQFNPFFIEVNPDSRFWTKNAKLKVVGIRKDGRLVYEDEEGNKNQLSDYDLSKYILLKPKNEIYNNQLRALEEERNRFIKNTDQKRKEIISKMDIVNLKEYKESLI